VALASPVRSLRAIRERKTFTTVGPWNSGKKMPRTAFPLSRSHSYPLGSGFEWCVCEAASDSEAYRLLVGFDASKAQYRAWLGLVAGHDTKLLARLEYHPSHKGWHVHIKLGDVEQVVRGVVREPRGRDRSKGCRADDSFSISQLDALSLATKVFNIEWPGRSFGLF
jgi:hypothetical protein